MLIVVPLVTETKDTLIGCAMLICGLVPYWLWRDQTYTPKPIVAMADSISSFTGNYTGNTPETETIISLLVATVTRKLQLLLPVTPGELPEDL